MLSGLVKYLVVMLRIQIVSRLTIRACGVISSVRRSITHISASIDIEAASEAVSEITKLPHRGYRDGLQILLKLRRLPHAPPPPHTRPQRLPLLAPKRRDDGDGVRARGDDGRRGVEAHAADGDERRVGGHEAAPGRDAVEAARREGDVLGRRAEDG